MTAVADPARAGHSTSASAPRRLWRSGTLALVLVLLAQATVIQALGWNQTSHYALVRAIDHGTARIDPYQSTTGDKARYRGHWFSARAPGLALFSVPAYAALRATGVTTHARTWIARKRNDEIVWLLGIWGAALPALLIMLIARRLADAVAPGHGTAAAVTLGLGTLLLPFATMLFSHVFSALLAFAAFALLWRTLDRPRPRVGALAAAGLLIGYGIATEYPILFAGAVLGVYTLLKGRPALRTAALRGATYAAGVVVGALPIAIYDRLAFGSFTHIAYADIPKQHAGFFGIRVPNPAVAVQLLLSSRGLLTLAPVLALATLGIVLLHRAGRRAEAWAIAAVALVYLAYNSGYYLPYGGTVPGPRFLITVLPFLAVPLALAYRRHPGPTLALAGASVACMVVPTLTKPMVSAEGDTGIWTRLLGSGEFQASVGTLAGIRDQWLAQVPFLALAFAATIATAAVTRLRLSARQLAAGAAATLAWAAFAAFGPHAFGIDHAAGERIVHAGDPKGTLLLYGPHPIEGLVAIGLGAAIFTLAAGAAVWWRPWTGQPHAAARNRAHAPG